MPRARDMNRVVVVRSVLPEGAIEAPARALGKAFTLGAVLRFETVYRDHAGFVWRVLRGMGVAEALVEDAVQDAFVVVHRRLPEFDGRHSVKTWLFAIAYRIACDYRRKLKRTNAQEPLGEHLSDAAPGPAEVAERNQALGVLAALLDGMDDEKRAVLVLAEIEGMTVPEIATVTGVPLNTVYTRLRRARLELNASLTAWKERAP